MLSGVKVLVQVICTKCPERAEFRSVVAKVEYNYNLYIFWNETLAWQVVNAVPDVDSCGPA